MTTKCILFLLIITSSLLIIFFSLLVILSSLLEKVELQGQLLSEMHQTLSELQIEKIEYVKD